jgi:hypothetical protein
MSIFEATDKIYSAWRVTDVPPIGQCLSSQRYVPEKYIALLIGDMASLSLSGQSKPFPFLKANSNVSLDGVSPVKESQNLNE